MIRIGRAVSVLGLMGASFATAIGVLIATRGVIYRMGFMIMYSPVISTLNEWFVATRGLALGTIQASTSVSGIAMPLILANLLGTYDYTATTRAIIAVVLVVLTGPVLPVQKASLPVSLSSRRQRIDMVFL